VFERVLYTTKVGLLYSMRIDGEREGSGSDKVQRIMLLTPVVFALNLYA
jgi:hypothetical protein